MQVAQKAWLGVFPHATSPVGQTLWNSQPKTVRIPGRAFSLESSNYIVFVFEKVSREYLARPNRSPDERVMAIYTKVAP